MKRKKKQRFVSSLAAIALVLAVNGAANATSPFIGQFGTITVGVSSAPGSGFEPNDLNPYGVAVVPKSIGNLVQGDILVSNFNNGNNQQGTGSSIVQFAPDVGSKTIFAEIDGSKLPGKCPGGVGLTTALVVLRSGWVIVGSLPTTDGTIGTVGSGCLIVLDAKGNPVETFSGAPVNGPWDMTADDDGLITTLYFTNVLNGHVAKKKPDVSVDAATVIRMRLATPPQGFGSPSILDSTVVGSGFAEENDVAALIIGPTGVALGGNQTLYVADTVNSAIRAIPQASTRLFSAGIGQPVSSGDALNGPLGLAIAPDGDILTVNSGDGNIVETTPGGTQVAVRLLEPVGAGSLFGLAVAPEGNGIYFVDDSNNTLSFFH